MNQTALNYPEMIVCFNSLGVSRFVFYQGTGVSVRDVQQPRVSPSATHGPFQVLVSAWTLGALSVEFNPARRSLRPG